MRQTICTTAAVGAALLALSGAKGPSYALEPHLDYLTPQRAVESRQISQTLEKRELPTAIVSLGDSFIAGNGGRWLGNSSTLSGGRNGTDRAWNGYTRDGHVVYGTSYDNRCYRSDVAEIQSVALHIDRKINLACSAAKTENLLSSKGGGSGFKGEPPQGDQLADIAKGARVKMIVVSTGGNDLGFG